MSRITSECIPFMHVWSKWSRPVQTYDFYKKLQWRECVICGRVKNRTIHQDAPVDSKLILAALQEVNPL